MRLGINYWEKKNAWSLNNMLLNNQWKQKQEIKIYLETNEDGNRAFQDLWDTEKNEYSALLELKVLYIFNPSDLMCHLMPMFPY